MNRIALMVLRKFFQVPYYMFKIWLCGKSDKYTEEERYAIVREMTIKANQAGRVTIETHGLENLPEKNGFILFPNHQGLFDALTVLESCPRPFAIVIRDGVANIILIKQVLAALRGLTIKRDDVRSAVKVIAKMTEEVKAGRNYLIFSEGTRSRNGNKLLEMKGGSFKSAMNAKCPIVPVAMIDSFKPFDEKSIKPVTVQIHYLRPMCYEEYQGMKSTEIAKIVKERIEETIEKFEKSE